MDVYRDAPPVVSYLNLSAVKEGYFNLITAASYSFINAIVDDLEDEMVKPPLVCTSDIHPRAAANCLQSLQDLDILGGVVILHFLRGVLSNWSCFIIAYFL